jgi:hypothetical protein
MNPTTDNVTPLRRAFRRALADRRPAEQEDLLVEVAQELADRVIDLLERAHDRADRQDRALADLARRLDRLEIAKQ